METFEDEARAAFGRVLKHALTIAGLTDKEARAVLGAAVNPQGKEIDASQFGRWLTGRENPQMWRFYRVPKLRDALRAAEALDAGMVVETVIRRPA